MKFAKELDARTRSEWAGLLPPYKAIKKLLSVGGADVTNAFAALLQPSVDAANSYVADARTRHAAALLRIQTLRDTLVAANGTGVDVRAMSDARRALATDERALWEIGRDAHDFAELAYTAYYKSAKKHDKMLGKSLLVPLLAVLEAQPFLQPLDSFPSLDNATVSGENSEAVSGESSEAEDLVPTTLLNNAQISLPPPALADAVAFLEALPQDAAHPMRLHVFRSYAPLGRADMNEEFDENNVGAADQEVEAAEDPRLGEGDIEVEVAVEGEGADLGLSLSLSPLLIPTPPALTRARVSMTVLTPKPLETIEETLKVVKVGPVPVGITEAVAHTTSRIMISPSRSELTLPLSSFIPSSSTGLPLAFVTTADSLNTSFTAAVSYDAAAATESLVSFDAAMASLSTLASSALAAAAPELATDPDGAQRLHTLRVAVRAAHMRVVSLPPCSVERAAAAAAEKHIAFGLAARALSAQFALAQPEHAAALEYLVAAHHALFSADMPDVPPPPSDHAALLAGLGLSQLRTVRMAARPQRTHTTKPPAPLSSSSLAVLHHSGSSSKMLNRIHTPIPTNDSSSMATSADSSSGGLVFVPWPDDVVVDAPSSVHGPQPLQRLRSASNTTHGGASSDNDASVGGGNGSAEADETPFPVRSGRSGRRASATATTAVGPIYTTPPLTRRDSQRNAAQTRANRRAFASLGPAWGSFIPSTPALDDATDRTIDGSSIPRAVSSRKMRSSTSNDSLSYSAIAAAAHAHRARVSSGVVTAATVASPLAGDAEPKAAWYMIEWSEAVRWMLGGGGVDEAGGASAWGGKTAVPQPLLSLLRARLSPPLLLWIYEYNWRKSLRADVTAGMTIGVLLIPQGLACASLSGVPASHGLWSAFPAVVYAIFGSSAHAAIGPMSIPSLLVASGVEDVLTMRAAGGALPPPSTERARLALITTLLAGLILLAMGALRLGFLVRFLSRPVLSGFTAAAAVLTMLSSAKDLSGAPVKSRAATLPDLAAAVVTAAPFAHAASTVLGLATLIALFCLANAPQCARLRAIVPPALVVVTSSVIIMTIGMLASGDSGVGGATAGGVLLVGAIPATIPSLWLPWLEASWEDARALFPSALGVAIVGFVESIAVAKLYAQKHGYGVNANGELLALGITNLIGAVVARSLVTMGAFGRSAVNNASGARSQMSGFISAATVAALLGFVAPALFYLPKPVLAAIIIFAVVGLIDIGAAIRLWSADRRDFWVFCVALAATLMLGVSTGVAVAALISLIVFLAVTTQPRVEELGRVAGTVVYRHLGLVGVHPVRGVKVLRFLAPLFFANQLVLRERIAREVAARADAPPRFQWAALVVCLASVSSVDSSACQMLLEASADLRSKGLVLVLASANVWVEEAFVASGLIQALAESVQGGGPPLFQRVHDAVRAVLLGRVRPATAKAKITTPTAIAPALNDGPVTLPAATQNLSIMAAVVATAGVLWGSAQAAVIAVAGSIALLSGFDDRGRSTRLGDDNNAIALPNNTIAVRNQYDRDETP